MVAMDAPEQPFAAARRGGATIRPLGPAELASPGFLPLLRLAAELDDAELAGIVRGELPALTVIGVVEEGAVIGFAAADLDSDPVLLEYIAVAETAQGRGLGAAIVGAVREAAGGRAMRAETDDDAVAFYRRIGFAIIPLSERDPRWPDRPRYACALA